jgi:signal recognition particle receptor subunit beta
MAVIDIKARQINCKIVYYGTGFGGKTTNLRHIHKKTNPKQRGQLLSLQTESERTLFFDFFPMSAGTLMGMELRFSFYTVPGQSFYNLTRKTILKDVDGIVFVSDSDPERQDANIDSYLNLGENLAEIKIDIAKFPHVIQYNKRDLPEVMPLEQMKREINTYGVPDYEAVALQGQGVFDTLREVSKLTIDRVKEKVGR